jgi:hypothetical protein
MQDRTVWRIVCASILLVLSGTSAAAQASDREPVPGDAVRNIVAAFKQHPIVIIGEAHWLRQASDFYVRMVRDQGFQETVQDIVIEFASQNNQPLLDRYIAGENVPIEDVRHIWRDTTKVASVGVADLRGLAWRDSQSQPRATRGSSPAGAGRRHSN